MRRAAGAIPAELDGAEWCPQHAVLMDDRAVDFQRATRRERELPVAGCLDGHRAGPLDRAVQIVERGHRQRQRAGRINLPGAQPDVPGDLQRAAAPNVAAIRDQIRPRKSAQRQIPDVDQRGGCRQGCGPVARRHEKLGAVESDQIKGGGLLGGHGRLKRSPQRQVRCLQGNRPIRQHHRRGPGGDPTCRLDRHRSRKAHRAA